MSEWLEVVGRFHPLVLHLPIGLIAGVALLEATTLLRGSQTHAATARLLVWLAALSAVAAAGTGFFLGQESGYDQDAVSLHKWLGIAVAAAAVITASLYGLRSIAWPRRAALGLTLALLLPTGHLGAAMTHGDNFLFEPLNPKVAAAPRPAENPAGPRDGASVPPATTTQATPGNPPSAEPAIVPVASVFDSQILPIFTAKCINCHGSTKRKGGLALHTAEALAHGGKDGPAVVAGDVDGSEIVRRFRLPLDDDEHMPPSGKSQLTPQEITAIESWIAAGASTTAPAGIAQAPAESSKPAREPDSSPSSASTATPSATPAPISTPALAEKAVASAATSPEETLAPAPEEALAAIREQLVHVSPVTQGSPKLLVDFAAVAPQTTDAQVEKILTPIRSQVSELSLARTKITDASMKFVASLPNLRRLDVRSTPVTAAGVAALRDHRTLEILNLAQTKLSPEVIETIPAIQHLTQVFVWNAGLTPEAIADLRQRRAELSVDAGDRTETKAAEAETEVKFTSDAPAPGQPAVAAKADLAPINQMCPVSGKAVDPNFAIVYKGRVIGFCCEHCGAQFWADPSKFEAKLPPQ